MNENSNTGSAARLEADLSHAAFNAPAGEGERCLSATDKVQALLRSGKLRPCEELDDYSGDFGVFVPLDGIETADMRHQRERRKESADLLGDDCGAAGVSLSSPPDRTGSPASEASGLILEAALCLHGCARREGCRRCIQACPSGAIDPGEEVPHLEPSKCAECGICAAACPTGALSLASSREKSALHLLKERIQSHGAAESAPIVVFHGHGAEIPEPGAAAQRPVVLLGVGSAGLIGMEHLLGALALGAARVYVLAEHRQGREREQARLAEELEWTLAVLTSLGYASAVVRMLDGAQLRTALNEEADGLAAPPATFAPDCSKRILIRRAADHLARHSAKPHEAGIALPAGAPFGAVAIDRSACTLCMACAGACKLKALLPLAGGVPGLQFTESECVQCGLCTRICPEKAVTMTPRLNLNPGATAPATLHQEESARCLSCGRPFASRGMIAAIRRKLNGHWMYEGPRALRRLDLCDRCRVQELYFSSIEEEK